MYGLVNKAIENMVVTNFGDEQWEMIKIKAGVEVESFLSLETYDDKITYQLVGAASDVLKTPATEILRLFGNYWIKFGTEQGYGHLLRMTGSSLFESLQHLDHLHARLSLSFPNYKPPSFRCTEITDTSLRLHYYSSRNGLAHFVIGLVEGLAEMVNTKASVLLEKGKDQGHTHDEFLVTII